MSDSTEQSVAVRDVRDEFRADLDAFEATERKLLIEERRERARVLSERFNGLALRVGE
ncbi:hypothetical protein KQX63_00825 [Rhodopseudomonas palustris]|uniref:Uncharacterized protein n=1 Tax=Rhodopseudomonas palustris TaxID=1076 RepID=A0AAX3DZ62_RHOPL|nr:hypothetical protein [Rhodopseudomonas palustris]UYO39880.1 hypothetical protein KQX62_00805 [Rhodopseudomonas palustris]UYO44611.1 hypothetical protein KQX63_00825 [Rhodopseudomonas palustris]UYO49215.1 hypothetical protein KQX64_00825 [Rhodopseudomonas palustris]UYO53990.1 hypothetical protein KQX61_00825 [Rhodopseudomonas palustris]